MKPSEATPIQRMRIDTATWSDLKHAAPAGNRSGLIKAFIHWYLRRPGAELPQRPRREEHHAG